MVVILPDDVVIFSHFKINWFDSELRPGPEFLHAAGIRQGYPSNSHCLVAFLKNVGTNTIKGDQGFYLWASAFTAIFLNNLWVRPVKRPYFRPPVKGYYQACGLWLQSLHSWALKIMSNVYFQNDLFYLFMVVFAEACLLLQWFSQWEIWVH